MPTQLYVFLPSFLFLSLFLFPSDASIVCTARRLLNVWSPLEDSQLIRAASQKPWHSLSQQLSIPNGSLTKSGTSSPPLIFMLGFGLSWTCVTLLKWRFSFSELIYATVWQCPKNTASLQSPASCESYTSPTPSSAVISEPWKEGGWYKCPA